MDPGLVFPLRSLNRIPPDACTREVALMYTVMTLYMCAYVVDGQLIISRTNARARAVGLYVMFVEPGYSFGVLSL